MSRAHLFPMIMAVCTLTAAAFLSACVGLRPTPDPTEFFVLERDAGPAPTAAASGPVGRVEVAKIRISDYLEDPRLVLREGPNKVSYSEYYRWAESLESALPMVLTERVRQASGSQDFVAYPDVSRGRSDYKIIFSILKFEGDSSGRYHFLGTWRVEASSGVPPRQRMQRETTGSAQQAEATEGGYLTGVVDRTGAWDGQDYANLVGKLDAHLTELAHDAAKGLQSLDEQ